MKVRRKSDKLNDYASCFSKRNTARTSSFNMGRVKSLIFGEIIKNPYFSENLKKFQGL